MVTGSKHSNETREQISKTMKNLGIKRTTDAFKRANIERNKAKKGTKYLTKHMTKDEVCDYILSVSIPANDVAVDVLYGSATVDIYQYKGITVFVREGRAIYLYKEGKLYSIGKWKPKYQKLVDVLRED